MNFNIAALKERGSRPRVHGNGFIQLDLTDTTRLHVWGDKRIPRQNVYTPIHDHVFGFKSTLIVGRLFNVIYGFNYAEFGDYAVWEPRVTNRENTILERTKKRVRLFPIHTDLIAQNTSDRTYEMDPFIFHETFATEPTATIIKKWGPTQAQGAPIKPRVLVRFDQDPDNSFNRYNANPDVLWRIIERVLKRR